jgi:Kef-type K+ transport system membrane component KefB
MHADPVVPLLLALVVILAAAKVGGWLAERLRQPAVLGELLIGIVLGNLGLAQIHVLEPMKQDVLLATLAELGVILLLFDVGLESTVGQMMKVGRSAVLVAVLGVIAPFALGWGVGAWLLPEKPAYVHAFLGAVLTATSVGITARVLRDLDRSRSKEARIILGAAVIDDVLGLVILAVVGGIITAANEGSARLPIASLVLIAGKALLFLVIAIVFGSILVPRALRVASKIRVRGILLTSGLIFCFLLSYLAAQVGLAPIVGAFAAGLILEPAYFEAFEERKSGLTLRSLVDPIAIVLVPIFFVRTGMLVDLGSFADPSILGLAAAITVAACLGKGACMLGVLERGLNRLAIGIGMVPRGEVGLIFANVGAALTLAGEPIVTPSLYAAIVFMVIVTTLVTPPALQWSLSRGGPRRRGRARRARDEAAEP